MCVEGLRVSASTWVIWVMQKPISPITKKRLRSGPVMSTQVARGASGINTVNATTKRQNANEMGGMSRSAGLVMG